MRSCVNMLRMQTQFVSHRVVYSSTAWPAFLGLQRSSSPTSCIIWNCPSTMPTGMMTQLLILTCIEFPIHRYACVLILDLQVNYTATVTACYTRPAYLPAGGRECLRAVSWWPGVQCSQIKLALHTCLTPSTQEPSTNGYRLLSSTFH